MGFKNLRLTEGRYKTEAAAVRKLQSHPEILVQHVGIGEDPVSYQPVKGCGRISFMFHMRKIRSE